MTNGGEAMPSTKIGRGEKGGKKILITAPTKTPKGSAGEARIYRGRKKRGKCNVVMNSGEFEEDFNKKPF